MVNSKRPKRERFHRHGRHFDNPQDIVGEKFGQLAVLEFLRTEPKKGNVNSYFYRCRCQCGKIVEMTRWKLITDHTKSCGCRKKRSGAANPMWKGYQEISRKFWSDNKARARKRKLAFEINIEEGWALYENQNRCCALSGLPLEMKAPWDNANRRYHNTRTASLDRIDPTKGYVRGNLQWVHKEINHMKSDTAQSRFLELCQAVVRFRGENDE